MTDEPSTNGGSGDAGDGGVAVKLGRKDFQAHEEVRWCPGCGDYSILANVQLLMPELGVRPENLVFVSGIGCAARFPYYMNVYGVHGIHGRAPAIATGIALARPDLDVWVITGDGDVLSIGGNHLIHALRRNVNLTIVMFNNQIYGLTKGQYSPTSEVGKITKSSPFGSLDYPFNPLTVALGAEATFVARTHDMDRKHMMDVLRRAHFHQGAAFVEVYQNCNVFNDGAFEGVTAKEARAEMLIELHDGEPIRFGADAERGVVLNEFGGVRGRERRRRRGRSAPGPRRDAREPVARVRVGAARVGAHHAHADRRVPRGRAAHVRARGAAPARAGGRPSGPRRPGRGDRLGRDLGRQLT